MADKKITELTNITGANLVDADEFVVVDISADETKAITLGELKEAFDAGSGFVRITGDTMTGDLGLSGADITFGDNDKAIFGAGSDLQIYHDGSQSYIKDAGTGNLLIQGANIRLESDTGENFLAAFPNAEVRLYYDSVEKLATTATGIDVTGTVTADGLAVGDGGAITIDAGAVAANPRLYFDHNNLTGGLYYIETDRNNQAMEFATSSAVRMQIASNGDISFYEYTGTTPKFFWDASAESLGIGTSSPVTSISANSQGLAIQHSNVPFISLEHTGASGKRYSLYSNSAGSLVTYDEDAASTRMVIDSSGNLLVGKTSVGYATDGFEARAAGYASVSDTDTTPFLVNRNGTGDGNLISFYKAGATVGSIGTRINGLRIDKGNTLLSVYDDGTTNSFFPESSGDDVDLGLSTSGFQWKDLYLSGTANVDTVSANAVDLSAIASTISDTAVDIFVYDTRKDSDGGAWRKRTQGTSWYNETLNTATRGSRKEFPAVAVIVAESNQVTIYDGDDPDLPMWMVFNRASDSYFASSSVQVSSLSMLNGYLILGMSSATREVDFLKDFGFLRRGTADALVFSNPISGRNSGNTFANDSSIPRIVNNSINDVAMTVLPNAPIDAATGLPVPTIAVATDGGVSVIKDDGTVVDITLSVSNHVAFYDNGARLILRENGSACSYGLIPNTDAAHTTWREGFFNETTTFPSTLDQTNTGLYSNGEYDLGIPSGSGLSLIKVNPNDQATSTGAYITSDYNTGWMNGDIKLATLSDTDTTNVTGSELVTNGTFDTNTTGWTAANSTLSASGGQLTVTSTANGAGYAYQAISVVSGKKYVATTDSISGTGVAGKTLYVGTSAGFGNLGGVQLPGDGSTVNFTFTASGTNTVYIFMYQDGNTASGDTTVVDNISVRLAEEDRSVNGNGLQVFGTVTKNPVATGADLVAYSGFSGSNYLQQPYNSDLEVGTGDISFMGWVKKGSSTGYQIILQRDKSGDNVGTGSFEMAILNTTGQVLAQTYDGAAQTATSTSAVSADTWSFICGVIDAGVLKIYFNGVLEDTVTPTTLSTSGEDVLTFGIRTNHSSNPMTTGSLALWRISATAPSPQQILKIYNDEKHLFTEGAQATLYGSSDSVTALAYDTDSELLHVGTSAGRSVFQGLRRVDNTTDAVGAAISASNGLVAEE